MMRQFRFRQVKNVFISILETAGKKNVTVFAAAADCFLFMSLVPVLMLLVSLIRFLPFDQADIMALFADTMPASVFSVINSIVNSIYRDGGTAFTVSLFLTLFSASGAMRPLMKGLDAIYGDERRDSLPVFFLRAVFYMAVLVVIIVSSIVVLVFGGQILKFLQTEIPGSTVIGWLSSSEKFLRYFLELCFLTLGFLLLYCRVPARKRKPSGQWPGAVFCAFAWVIFSWLFSLYMSISDKFGAYGYIGTIMVAMIWVYWCLTLLLFGGCINASIEQIRN